MLLPTQHENFGHVIVESWQNGCPVIISDQTPWHSLEKDKLGVELTLEQQDQFTNYIEQFAAMDQTEFNEWSKSAHKKGTQIANDPTIIEKYKELFKGINRRDR
jgi:glycosyltransferase involved in cell wall biosynthesis